MVAFGAETFHVSIGKERGRDIPMITGPLFSFLFSYLFLLLFDNLLKEGEAEMVNIVRTRLGHLSVEEKDYRTGYKMRRIYRTG